LIGTCLLTALFSAPNFEANATSKYTVCNYSFIAGAPWAPSSKSFTHSGHIQCAKNKTSAIGYYGLTSQRHYN